MTEITVFISSKMKELSSERNLIRDFLPTLNEGIITLKPWIFESDAPASEESIRDVYLKALQNSSLYIGIFWNDYGEWTIDEFERAGEWNIPRHIYVKDVNTDKRDPKLSKFLETAGDVSSGITAKWFKTEEELKTAIGQSITEWVKNSLHFRSGANRAVLYSDPDNIIELASTQLFGREEAMREIKAHLAGTNARVLLQAIGGTGKTVLAAQIAYGNIQNTDKPTLWLRFGASDADSAFEALAHAFNQSNQMASTPTGDKPRLLNQLIKAHSVNLVVLDDVWNGQSLMAVLQGIPRNVPVLVTARQRYSLNPLISLPDLLPDDAVKLLSRLAPDFTKNDDDVNELAEALYHHAFALEIAGRTMQAKSYPASKMLQAVKKPFEYSENVVLKHIFTPKFGFKWSN